ncbi:MAG: amidohydrolase [Maioricimonas sp. JB049]
MTHDTYSCLCCSPLVSNIFQETDLEAKMTAATCGCDDDDCHENESRGISRRAFNTRVSAIAGASLSLGLATRKAHAREDDRTRVFRGGTILTIDKEFSEAEAIAIRGNRILAVGRASDVLKAAGDDAQTIDLKGRVLLPGFIDPHTHMLSGSLIASLMEYVGIARFATTAEVLEHLRGIARGKAPGEWVVARNFDPSLQEGPAALTFHELDSVSADHPVFVLNSSGHLAYANRAAFKAAGIDETVQNPDSAEFVRDEAGKLTGMMKNNVAFLKVLQHYPALGHADPVKTLIQQSGEFARLGLTTLTDLGMGALYGARDWQAFQRAGASGDLKARMRVYPFYTVDEAWDEAGVKPGDGNALVRIAGYKVVADGSNQGFTGLQREPYLNTQSRGLAYTSPEELKRLILKRGRQNWPLAMHGNGDQAIDNILDALTEARQEGLDIKALRPRIEHCSILHDDQIQRMQDLGVSPSFLIGHVHYWGVAMRDTIFGEAKANLLARARSCEKAGIGFTLHSDFFVTDPEPLHQIEMAVTRRTLKEPDYVLAPDERVSVESAIRAVTSEAAWQLGSEHEIGSLEAGKFADLVILANDPRKVDPVTIKDIPVLETWMDGKKTFSA